MIWINLQDTDSHPISTDCCGLLCRDSCRFTQPTTDSCRFVWPDGHSHKTNGGIYIFLVSGARGLHWIFIAGTQIYPSEKRKFPCYTGIYHRHPVDLAPRVYVRSARVWHGATEYDATAFHGNATQTDWHMQMGECPCRLLRETTNAVQWTIGLPSYVIPFNSEIHHPVGLEPVVKIDWMENQ